MTARDHRSIDSTEYTSLDTLSSDERMRLMKFVCSMAWADLEIADEERELVASLIRRLELDPDERQSVAEWLKTPPRPEAVDPTRIPRAHRELFRATLQRTVESDGTVSPEERIAMRLFDRLVR